MPLPLLQTAPAAGSRLCIDIGIFARNEADAIGNLIADLGAQSIMSDDRIDLRMVVLANGCCDQTAARAREAAAALPPAFGARLRVLELPEAGKSRTVHRFIHDLSRPEAEFLCLMDADIRLPKGDNLRQMVVALARRPDLRVFNSRPVKDTVFEATATGPVARLIAAGSGGLDDWRTAICGQLFMIRAAAARRIGLPPGLPVEDGFMRAMVLTDLLTAPEDLSRIDGDQQVFHVYRSIRTAGELVRHQTRIVIGSAVNAALFARIRREARDEAAAHALLMAAAGDERWIGETLRADLPRRPYGFVPFDFLLKRLRRQRAVHSRSLKRWLVTLAGVGLDTLVWARASVRMMRGAGPGYW